MKENHADRGVAPGIKSWRLPRFPATTRAKSLKLKGDFMKVWQKTLLLAGMAACAVYGCKGGDSNKEVDVQKVMQEAAEKERKMYEGAQKSVEGMEKNLQQQAEKK
jgi:hypothetical protein